MYIKKQPAWKAGCSVESVIQVREGTLTLAADAVQQFTVLGHHNEQIFLHRHRSLPPNGTIQQFYLNRIEREFSINKTCKALCAFASQVCKHYNTLTLRKKVV